MTTFSHISPRCAKCGSRSLALGKLNHRKGNRGQAREHLTIAAMYRHMNMTYWLERTAPEVRRERDGQR